MKTWGAGWTLLVLVAACGDASAGADASLDARTDADAGIAVPVIPWLDEGRSPVELGPCPDGWRTVTDTDPVECDPYPEAGRQTCAEGEAHFPGEAGCGPIGSSCPAGDFATSLPTGTTVLYVLAGAAAGGTGTLAAPFVALADVPWSSLAADTTIALGKGTYPGTLSLKSGVHVQGACAAETILTGVDAPVLSVISVTNAGPAATVSDLSIRNAAQRGAYVERGRSLDIEGVLFDAVTTAGVAAVDSGSRLTLVDSVIRGTRTDGGGGFGFSIVAESGARIEANRTLVTESAEGGVVSDSPGTVIALTDTAIVDSVGLADGRRGRGATVRSGSRLEATRVLIADNQDIGVIVGLAGSEVIFEDVVIRDTRADQSDGTSGRGVSVQDGGRLTATRLVIANCADIGLFMSDPETAAELRHVVIRDTRPLRRDDTSGRGISISNGPVLDAANLALLRNHDTGLFVSEGAARATLVDVLVADTRPQPADAEFGRGLVVQQTGVLDATRLVVERNHEIGILAHGEGAQLSLTDAVIRDTLSVEPLGRGGLGVASQDSATVTGARVQVVNVREHGLTAIHASLTMRDVSVVGVRRADCSAATCPDRPFAHGISTLGGTVNLSGFVMDDVTLCGLLLVADAAEDDALSVDVSNGTVSHAEIGVCVQAVAYDLSRLTMNVDFLDNGTNLDSTALPLPEVAAASASF